MSYDNPRIELHMSYVEIVSVMSEGNPGAINVLMLLFNKAGEIDPDDVMSQSLPSGQPQGIGPWLGLDSLDCYGANIWVFFKDICGSDLIKMVGVLRAIQLGYTSNVIVMSAIKGARTGAAQPLDIDDLLKQVRERLPRFGQQQAAA